jgi:putative membrane protein insertion efficiency factor
MRTLSTEARAESANSGPKMRSGAPGNRNEGPTRFVRGLLVGAIRLYQLLRAGRPSPCRYAPSCSEYAAEALEIHGVARGGFMALRRIGRCHPWGGHGFDPVPQTGGSR